MKYPEKRLIEIAEQIGEYFLNHFNGDYKQTNDFIDRLQIQNIEENEAQISICTARPGLLIGLRGVHCRGLQRHLSKKINIVETFSWSNLMYPPCLDGE